MAKEQYVEVKVLVEQTYMVPVVNGKTYNGWTVDELMYDWFKQVDINTYHAARSSSKLGGGDKVISINTEKLIDVPEGTI